ncbi:MAG: corrinoid protein [Anaerolineae bacterium]
MDSLLRDIYQAIVTGDRSGAPQAVQAALDAGIPADTILQEALISAMTEVGRLFEAGEYFVPEMLIAAHVMKAGLALLKPLLVESAAPTAGTVVIGTVKGDMHDIGKNLVAMMLEGSGFNVIDLGTDVAPERFVAAAQEHRANIIAMSALLTTTMPSMRMTIEAVERAGLRDQVRIMVGGAPVTADFATQIGADGFAPDASRAAALARTLLR